MNVFARSMPVALAALILPAAAASAQSVAPSVNERLTAPTSQADAYMGVSLGKLLLALGLTLKGEPPQSLDDLRLFRVPLVAMAPRPGADQAAPPN